MTYIVLFILLCIFLGLWVPAKVRLHWLILVLAIMLVTLFILSPHRA